MQDRLRKVLAGSEPSPRLTIATECPPIPNGGDEQIAAWLDGHPEARLVTVDVFVKVRGRSDVRADRYETDYRAASALKDLADSYGVAFLLVHHTRKQESTDWLDAVSGTQGLSGAADSVLVLTAPGTRTRPCSASPAATSPNASTRWSSTRRSVCGRCSTARRQTST